MAVDTLGHLLAAVVMSANEQDRKKVKRLVEAVQEPTGDSVEPAYVDQGYTGEKPREAASGKGMKLEVVKLAEAKRGFVLVPRRWVLERSFAWAGRFRSLAQDYERLSDTLEQIHCIVFAILMLMKAAPCLQI